MSTATSKVPKKRKRKGRRLKKSVRLGCMAFILVALLLAGYLFVKFTPIGHIFDKTEEIEEIILPPDSVDDEISERIQKLVRKSFRIDSCKTAISILDLERRCIIYEQNSHRMMPPASCMKLLTAISAMHHLGVEHCYVNRVMTDGLLQGNTLQGDVVISFDDDPLVESLMPFAQAIKAHGINNIEGNIILNLTRTDTLRQHPTAAPWDIPYHKVPLLMKGSTRIKNDLQFALASEGITYQQMIIDTITGGDVIFEEKHPIRDVICPMLIHSSNIKAECMFYHTYQKYGQSEDEEIAESYTPQAFILNELGDTLFQRYIVNDGSGLSPENRLTSDFLIRLMKYAFNQEDMRQVLITEALATPGDPIRHGSLLGRMAYGVCRGRIFCKTGTITTIGASSLTGYAQNENGRWFAFSIINEDTPVYEARDFQDAICRALTELIEL